MLHAVPLLLALSSALSPESPLAGVCHAAQQASFTVGQTLNVLDARLVLGEDPVSSSSNGGGEQMLHARGHMVPHAQPAHFHLELPRLELGWLTLNAVGITISIAFLAGVGCASAWAWNDRPAMDLTGVVPVGAATMAIRYRPMVAVSLLAPWQTLMARLGEKPQLHGSLSVGVSVGSTMMMGGAMHPYGTTVQPGMQGNPSVATGTPWAAPSLRAPSVPSVQVGGRSGGAGGAVRGVRR